MPIYVLIIDILGIVFAISGFLMAFRPMTVRRWWRMFRRAGETERLAVPAKDDPVVYALRIAGVMIMIFGITIAGMMTFAHWLLA
ncbi:hypothetical protein ACFB49_46980 [Sphingomonas sp. DBB INV C78]|uniref:hypothetical protein n=1 Tax=Sphingomonas sp. DBB INV C78 TaxID=3349434 RepID=UPI0036D34AD6